MNVTMDRYESDWSIVKRGWDAHVLGVAPHTYKDATTAIKALRGDGKVTDQDLDPFVIVDEAGKPVGTVEARRRCRRALLPRPPAAVCSSLRPPLSAPHSQSLPPPTHHQNL